MFTKIFFLLVPLTVVVAYTKEPQYRIDEESDITSEDQNEVLFEYEKETTKTQEIFPVQIVALSSEDVKCLMEHRDQHCSSSMQLMKGVLIDALRHNCTRCTEEQKIEAGKVIITLMKDFPIAWKLIFTRYKLPELLENIQMH